VLVTRGHSIVVAAALGFGILAGWGIGAAHGECEHTCPAQGPCPTPADCLNHPFNWTGAVVLGAVVALIVVAVGMALLSRAGRD
jgi:hypothetical protein